MTLAFYIYFWFEETLGNFCLWGKIFVFQTVNSWKALVSAGAHVTLAPLGAQVSPVTHAYMRSISYSISQGRFEYTEMLGRQIKSGISIGSSNPGVWGFSQSCFCWRQLIWDPEIIFPILAEVLHILPVVCILRKQTIKRDLYFLLEQAVLMQLSCHERKISTAFDPQPYFTQLNIETNFTEQNYLHNVIIKLSYFIICQMSALWVL